MGQIPFEEARFYHVFNRGNNKENIFIEEKNYNFFLRKLKAYLLPICNIYAYCLLPNHFHLVLQIKEHNQLPPDHKNGKKMLHQPFSNFFNSYAKTVNKVYSRTGSLFQEHLHRNVIDSEAYFRDVIIYTLLNPVSHGFTNNYKTYPHSSFLAMVSRQKTDIMREQVIEYFENIENFIFCLDQRKFINQQRLKEIEQNDI